MDSPLYVLFKNPCRNDNCDQYTSNILLLQ